MEQQRQKLLREQDSQLDLSLFTDASWNEENNEALWTSRKRVFGEDPGSSVGGRELRSGGAAVPLPPELRLLHVHGVPHTLCIAASFGSVLIVRLKSLLAVVTRCKISGGTRYNIAQEKSPADF